jgi:selenocysteine lyase/cysteine desulfurase
VAEVLSAGIDVAAIRNRFSSLRRGFAFFDAPGGTQVPDEVGDAIARALRDASANLGAGYATSLRVGQILEEAEAKAARFLGCEPREVTFGPNMTTLNFALSRTAARTFRPGDEILVSCLDHDGGVAPWLEIARDRDLVVRHVALHDDTTLDVGDLQDKLGPRTKVVAFAWASNAVGTVTDARRVCQLAHDAGALAWVDAVHYAAHETIDVRQVGADVLICSPYKFCGPHLGTVYGLAGMAGRVPTFLVNVEGVAAADVAASLAAARMGVWAHDSWYSLGLYQRLGYTGQSVRIGFIHYNTADEIDRLLEALDVVRPS